MNFIFQKKVKSFTLLELLLVIVISSLIIICCINIFYSSYFVNLNQRKNYSKFQQINYVMNYIENEITNAVDINVNDSEIIIKKYTYNSFISENKFNISKINEIRYKINKYKEKYEIDRISKDILNSTNYGTNKLIKDLDFFDIKKFDNYLILDMGFNNKHYYKYIFFKNLERFKYVSWCIQ